MPSTWEAEAGRQIVGHQPGLYCKFQASLTYIVRLYLKKIKKQEKKIKTEIRVRNEVVECLTLWMGEERGKG